jgi:DegV family protein with EDD domain
MVVRIVTNSTCDLPSEVIARYRISMIPLWINVGSKGYLDGVDITREEFYTRLPEFNPQPTTAVPGTDVFSQVYRQLLAEGATQILSIHISEKLSAITRIAHTAAESMSGIPIEVLDSRQLSLGTGFLVETAARMAEEGFTLEEILPAMENQITRTHVFAALDTVEFLQRSGRMNFALASLVSLLHIKPLLKMYDGNPTSERVRTSGKAMDRLLALLNEVSPVEKAALVHTHAPEKAEALRQRAAHLLPLGEIPSVDITPVIGAHIRPGAVGFACVSRKR